MTTKHRHWEFNREYGPFGICLRCSAKRAGMNFQTMRNPWMLNGKPAPHCEG